MSSPGPTALKRLTRWHPRFELCAVCRRPALGFGWREPWLTSQPRPPRWFCSMACQALYAAKARKSSAMVDLTEEEQAAMRLAMKMIAEVMDEIGWKTRLSDLSEQQVLTLIEVAIGGFQDAMREIASTEDADLPF